MTLYARIRKSAKPFLKKHPAATELANRIEFATSRIRLLKILFPATTLFSPNNILAVNPRQIELVLAKPLSFPLEKKRLDLTAVKLDDNQVTSSFDAHFRINRPWSDTDFYNNTMKKITAGTQPFGCSTADEFTKLLHELETIFIHTEPFSPSSPRDIQTENSTLDIKCVINEKGQLILADDGLQLAIAKIKKLDSVPVRVIWRHAEWISFREDICRNLSKTNGRTYQPLLHPDLKDLPSLHDERRYELISSHLPAKEGHLLDLGANWGYFSQKFELEGFQCTACEISPSHVYFMRKLRDAASNNFSIHTKSFLTKPPKGNFDVVLALNIFHHFLKTERSFHDLKYFLNQLNAKCMFFEPNIANSKQMTTAYRDFSPEEFVQFVLDNTSFTTAQFIDCAEGNRPLYLLK